MGKADILDLEMSSEHLNTIKSRISHSFVNLTKIQQNLNLHFLTIFAYFLVKTWFQKYAEPIFFKKLISKNNFSPKFQLRKKPSAAPSMAKLGSEKFGLRATQKCLKVSKI